MDNKPGVNKNVQKNDFKKLLQELDRLEMNIMEIQDMSYLGGQDKVDNKCAKIVGKADETQPESLIQDFIKILEHSVCEKLFKRIGGFQDSSAIDVILPFLRVGNHYTRWRVKHTLYVLGYRPQSISEKAAWEIMDIQGPLGLHPKEMDVIPWGRRATRALGTKIYSSPLST